MKEPTSSTFPLAESPRTRRRPNLEWGSEALTRIFTAKQPDIEMPTNVNLDR